MTSPSQIAALYALQGLVGADRYDRRRILDVVRETNRRGAAEDPGRSEGLDKIVAMIREPFLAELGDNPSPVDALLNVAFSLGPFVHAGLDAASLVTVLARLADDLDRRGADAG